MNDHVATLRDCERELANAAPFGDWRTIVNRNLTFYDQAVRLLAKQVPVAKELERQMQTASVEQRFRLFGDPSIRTALNELLEIVKSGVTEKMPDEPVQVVEHAVQWFERGASQSPAELGGSSLRLELPPQRAVVWSVAREADGDVFGRRFQQLFDREISPSISSRPAVLREPTELMAQNLVKGAQLLAELVPEAGRSVMAHVHLIGLVDVADRSKWAQKVRADLCQSVSTHAVPGTIFLSPSVLRTPYHAAEALFHEAGHKKLSDLVFTRSIFRQGYSEKNSPTIRALWNRSLVWNSAEWSVDRALFAAHVYVHLGLFFALLAEKSPELQPRYGELDGMNPTASARGGFNRARYLLREIRCHADEALGADGIACLDWLQGVLERLDPKPPVRDPDVHLWLDRYDRETRELGTLLAMLREEVTNEDDLTVEAEYSTWSGRRMADHLVHSEIVSAFRALSILGENETVSFPFYNSERWSVQARSGTTLQETCAAFASLRTFISRTLRSASEASYTRTCQTRRVKTMKDMVGETVEHAGRHVDDLVAIIRRQKRRAGNMGQGNGNKRIHQDMAQIPLAH